MFPTDPTDFRAVTLMRGRGGVDFLYTPAVTPQNAVRRGRARIGTGGADERVPTAGVWSCEIATANREPLSSIVRAVSNTHRSSSAASAGAEPRACEAVTGTLTSSRRFSSRTGSVASHAVTPRTLAATLAPPAVAAGRGRTRHRRRGSYWRPPTPGCWLAPHAGRTRGRRRHTGHTHRRRQLFRGRRGWLPPCATASERTALHAPC